MKKNRKGKKAVQHELENDAEYKGLDKEAQEFLNKFNNEWYYGSRYGQYEINVDPEHKKDCERNNNRNKRDIFDVAKRGGSLFELSENELDFKQQADDEWNWQDVYRKLGRDEALHLIFEQAKRDIEEGAINIDVVLSRFLIKALNLRTVDERRRKQGGK